MYHRTEVAATKQFRVPPEWCIEDVCRENVRRVDPKTAEEKNDFDFLSRVTGPVAWPAFTPESEQRLPCNLALLMHIHQLGSQWELAEKAWHSGLVQTGSVLEWKRRPHYVVRSYPNGLLLWPLSGHRDGRLVPRDEERVTTMCASPIIFPPKSSQVFRLETKFLLLSTCSLWATVVNTPEQ